MVDRTKLYEGNRPNPRIPSVTMPSQRATHAPIAHAAPKPARTPVNTSHTKSKGGPSVYVTPPPAIPGHEHAPIRSIDTTGQSKHPGVGGKTTTVKPVKHAPVSKPAPRGNPTPKPRPTPSPPTGGTKGAPPTSSPAPNTGPSQNTGGGGLSDFLPILLIGAAILAGVYLYTHRKG